MALSERTRKFVMEITRNGTAPEDAAKAVGLPVSSVPEMMNNPAVKREIDLALGAVGIDQNYFANRLKELCEAKNANGFPDWSARAKGVQMLKDISGHDAPKQVNQSTTTYSYEERLLQIASEALPMETVREIDTVINTGQPRK